MSWHKESFTEAVPRFIDHFNVMPDSERLALIWREGGEWSVMDDWLLNKIMNDLDGSTIRVVLWLTRDEASELLSWYAGSK